jgi:hypothetical protein
LAVVNPSFISIIFKSFRCCREIFQPFLDPDHQLVSMLMSSPSPSPSPSPSSTSTSTRDVANDDDDDDAKISNEGTTSAVITLTSLTISVRIYILNYLGQTQDELMNLTLVSKQIYKDCKRPGIEWKIIPTIEIRPRKKKRNDPMIRALWRWIQNLWWKNIPTIEIRPQQRQEDDSIRTRVLMQNLSRHLLNNETKDKLQCYHHMRVDDVHTFDVRYREAEEITRGIQMNGILSLDFSSSSPGNYVCKYFPLALSKILPNLHEIDLSNTGLHSRNLLKFSFNCPLLEKVTWNNISKNSYAELTGVDMVFSNNLKEIYMNDTVFSGSRSRYTYNEQYSDFNSRIFIFYRCCRTLERVSILNSKLLTYRNGIPFEFIIPQNALIKFVRNVASLRWFRSDLTQENIDMLKKERPDIQFLN